VAPLIPVSTLIPALPFVGPSSEVSLARIWGLGATRAGKFTVVASIVTPLSADNGADRYGQTSVLVGLGAAQKGAGSKEVNSSRHWVVSLVVGVLVAAMIVGMFLLLVSQKL
jgi:hypothetical protein